MKKLLWAFLMVWPILANAQVDICKALEIRESRNPFLRQRVVQNVDLDTAEIIVVPLVFHIIHLGEQIGEGTNISDEQIQSCVVALNEDFRKIEGTNGDGLGVDTKIEFCLASRSPDNLPTTGIVRHDASDLIFSFTFSGQQIYEEYALDGVSPNSTFGSPQGVPHTYMKDVYGCWDIEDYLNIWVVSEIDGNNGESGIQGFSYVGFNDLQCDGGPVVLYNVVGTTGNIKFGNLNKTITHELGHNFNLLHTFGLGGSTCVETNCETQGDQVCDTPPTTTNYGCTPSNCADAQVNNYMDYTSQTCRNTFTQGQTERMREELWSKRNGYTSSLGCIPVVDIDGGISNMAITNPNCQTTFDITTTLANFGFAELTNPTLTLSNGVNQTSALIPLSLQAGETYTHTTQFSSLASATIYANVSFQQTESFLANNVAETQFVYADGNILKVEISPDVWSNEIDWELEGENGQIVAFGGDYPVFSQDSTFVDEFCLFGSCYTFKVYDTAGDGLCSFDFDDDGFCDANYNQFIRLSLNNQVIFELIEPDELDYGSLLTFDFCDEISECEGDLDGDSHVGVSDFLIMLSYMGSLSENNPLVTDFDGNGTTDFNDLSVILANYGTSCPAIVTFETILPNVDAEVLNGGKEIDMVGFYDLMGRIAGNDRGVLPKGIYIVVTSENGKMIRQKILIQ